MSQVGSSPVSSVIQARGVRGTLGIKVRVADLLGIPLKAWRCGGLGLQIGEVGAKFFSLPPAPGGLGLLRKREKLLLLLLLMQLGLGPGEVNSGRR